MPGVRSDGDVNSLEGATGGAMPGAIPPPIDGGRAVSSMGDAGAGRITGGAARVGGVDCALAGGDDDTPSTAPRTISQSLTARLLCCTAVRRTRWIQGCCVALT